MNKLFAAVFGFFIVKPITYVVSQVQGSIKGQAANATLINQVEPVAVQALDSAAQALVDRYKPAAVAAVNAKINAVEAAITAVSPATITSLETQLHSAVASNVGVSDVVTALQSATSAAITTGAAAYGIGVADDLSVAQIEKLRTAIVDQINAA